MSTFRRNGLKRLRLEGRNGCGPEYGDPPRRTLSLHRPSAFPHAAVAGRAVVGVVPAIPQPLADAAKHFVYAEPVGPRPCVRRGQRIGPRHVFPFGLGQQPIPFAGLPAQPIRIRPRVMPAHAHHRVTVGLREPGITPVRADGQRQPAAVPAVAGLDVGVPRLVDEGGIIPPRHLESAKGERTVHGDRVPGPLPFPLHMVSAGARHGFGLAPGRPHLEAAGRHHDHLRALRAVAETGPRLHRKDGRRTGGDEKREGQGDDGGEPPHGILRDGSCRPRAPGHRRGRWWFPVTAGPHGHFDSSGFPQAPDGRVGTPGLYQNH